MKVLFLDESGDHSLTAIDPQYPLFVLGGVITTVDYAKGEMADRLRAFKRDLLGREDIILHTADMVRNRKEVPSKSVEMSRRRRNLPVDQDRREIRPGRSRRHGREEHR